MKPSFFISLFTLFFSCVCFSQPNYPKQPENAEIISVDLKNFIDAFVALEDNSDTLQVLKTKYFDAATQGLKEYINRFDLTPNALKNAISNYPDVYSRISAFYNQIPRLEKVYVDELKKFQKILPNSVFPPTYLLVADYKGIAQASKFGQLVRVEYKCIDNSNVLLNVMLHELTHFQQAMAMGIENYTNIYDKKDNMLDLILREGSADFVTYYLVRDNESQFIKLNNYETDEVALWRRFKKDLKNQDKNFWLNVSFENNNNGNAIQLGYALGYKIVKSYYLKADDKSKALAEILKMKSPEKFMLQSNYSPK